MKTQKYPVTPAVRFLKAHDIAYEPHLFTYEEHGGTARTASKLQLDEHMVIKTIVFVNDEKRGLIVLMHGNCEVSVRSLARQLRMRHVEPASFAQANAWTGYLFGGTSPFGIKTALPVYVEKTIYDLKRICINGGKRGFQIIISPNDLAVLNPQTVNAAVQHS